VTPNRGPRVCLIVVFLALIGLVAPSQIVLDLRQRETPGIVDLFRQAPTRANLRRLESDLESRCRLAQAVRPSVQYARFVLLQDAGDQALLGRDGWFFYRPAVQYLVEPCPSVGHALGGTPKRSLSVAFPQNDIFAAIVSFRDDLAKRGIKLLVMPAPNKSSIYPEMLSIRANGTGSTGSPNAKRSRLGSRPARGGGMDEPSRGRPGSINPTTRQVLMMLKKAGVEIVDLFNVYTGAETNPQSAIRNPQSTRYYLAQDSHWSPEGMRLAAGVVARRLQDLGWIEEGPVKYDTRPVTINRCGDVLRMMRVPRVERLYEPEQIDCTQVINAETGKPYVDDPNSPILVLGDSFLRIYERDEPGSGGFIAHLAHNLGFGLTSVVNDGGASTLVRQQLARKPALLKGKKVVVWEFVERDIRFGTEGWQVIPLP
jgi:hypothetical protein